MNYRKIITGRRKKKANAKLCELPEGSNYLCMVGRTVEESYENNDSVSRVWRDKRDFPGTD